MAFAALFLAAVVGYVGVLLPEGARQSTDSRVSIQLSLLAEWAWLCSHDAAHVDLYLGRVLRGAVDRQWDDAFDPFDASESTIRRLRTSLCEMDDSSTGWEHPV